jgi:hypothetical protein
MCEIEASTIILLIIIAVLFSLNPLVKRVGKDIPNQSTPSDSIQNSLINYLMNEIIKKKWNELSFFFFFDFSVSFVGENKIC